MVYSLQQSPDRDEIILFAPLQTQTLDNISNNKRRFNSQFQTRQIGSNQYVRVANQRSKNINRVSPLRCSRKLAGAAEFNSRTRAEISSVESTHSAEKAETL